VSLQGGPTFAKKDIAGRRYCINPAGLLIGVMVSLSGHLRFNNKKGFFSLPYTATSADVSLSPKWLIVFYGAHGVRAC
jgi:hypothetical protein